MGKANKRKVELDWEDQTIFKDAVLGYISMPKAMVNELVDHVIFQRLHDIAQTGMETLYPGATHNRFCHSIGVYHLGKLAFQCFQQNIKLQHRDDIYSQVAKTPEACERVWNRWRFLFECACLLHDCGHSPLSHSLEFLYDSIEVKREDGTWENYGSDWILLNDFKDSPNFQEGFYKDKEKREVTGNAYGGQHERMSAHLIAHECGYRRAMERLIKDQMCHFDSSEEGTAAVDAYKEDQLQSDLEFVTRAIIGYPYDENATFCGEESQADQRIIYQLRNCIIKLLNGIIDVDNIDYSVRDATASGYKSAQVDYERLLKAETVALAYDHEDEGLELNGEPFDYSVRLRKFRSNEVKANEAPLRITISGRATLLVEQQTDSTGEKLGDLKITGDIIEDDERSGNKKAVRVIHIRDGSNTRIELSRGWLEIKPRSSDEKNGTQLYIRSDSLRGKIYGTIFTGGRLPTEADEINKVLRDKICKGGLRIYPAYHKSALSVIQGALDATNFESRWIYSHHVTTYNNNFLSVFLLEKYADYLFRKEYDNLFEELDRFLWTYKNFLANGEHIDIDNETLKERFENAKKQLIEIKSALPVLQDIGLPDTLPNFEADGQPAIFSMLLDVLYLLYRKQPVDEGAEDLQSRFCKAVQDIVSAVTEMPLDNSAGHEPSDLEKQIFRQAVDRLKSFSGYKKGMNTMSAILGMPDPKRIDGRIFFRTSDAGLRSAYHDLNQNASPEERERHKDLFAAIEQYESRQYLAPMWKSHAEFHFYTQGWQREWFYPVKKNQAKKGGESPSLIEEFFRTNTAPHDPKVVDYDRSLYLYFSDEAVKAYEQRLKDFWAAVKEYFPLDVLVYVPQKIRHKKLAGDETYVVWKNRVVTMKDIGLQVKEDDGESYFYLYYRLKETCEKKLDIYAFMDFMREQMEHPTSGNAGVQAGVEDGGREKLPEEIK